MDSLPVEVIETPTETVDIQSDSDLIEQDPIDDIIVRDQDHHQVASLPSDFTQEDLNVVINPSEDIVVPDQEHQEVVASLPSDPDFSGENVNVGPVVNAIIEVEVDVEPIEIPKDPDYACLICDRIFSSRSKLSLHLKGHHLCNQCGEEFHGSHGKRNYENHLKTHQKPKKPERPEFYKCSGCKKPFPSLARLNRHIKLVHNSVKKIKNSYCSICSKDFSFPSRLKKHINRVHESSENCSICHKEFSIPAELSNHLETEHSAKSKRKISTVDNKIPAVASQSENDSTATENDSKPPKSRRKQNIVLRNDF